MKTSANFKTTAAIFVAMFLYFVLPVQAQFPGSGQLPLDPKTIPQFVDPLPHFAYPGARFDATSPGTALIVEAMPLDEQALSTGTVLPNGTVVSPTTGLTHVWGYRLSDGTTTLGPHWPGHSIVAVRGVPLNVLYLNNLDESYDAINLTVDQTLHWAMGMSNDFDPYLGDVPLVTHLHGAEVPVWSDGGPDGWFTPGGTDAGSGAMTNVYYYPNTQEPATLWYHDHALGVTRANVYAGLAGFYFLKDASEDMLHLPGWSGDSTVQEYDPVTNTAHGDPYLPEIEIVFQDRMFDQDGQLYFPAGAVGGAPNPSVHPWWIPEFVGDIMTVNGKTWPYMSVAPRKYRFRLLNGSNARFYQFWLQNLPTKANGPVIWQIGTDGGLLDAPVSIDPALGGKLILGPGERADVIIDFSSVANPDPAATYAVWTLKNSGRTPFPKGAPPNGSTLGQVMQFIVNGTTTGDNSVITGRSTPLEKLADFNTGLPNVTVDKQRQLTLNEVIGAGGPLEVLVNNTKWNGNSPRPYDDFTLDPSGSTNDTYYSEIINEGETEVWQMINLTADAHPIHLHLVQFQLLSRQNFNLNRYNRQYNSAFVAAGNPGGFVGAWGPPLDYNTGNDPSGTNWTPYLGGNPDVTPYLQGMLMPAEPNERGWKDTFIMYPGEVTTVIVRFAPTDAGATGNDYFAFDPSAGDGGYVWHCHILDHEDNEMMRPYHVVANGPARLDAPIYAGYWTSHPFGSPKLAEGGNPVNAAMPESFTLNQNFPNPFNATTKIAFSLPEPGDVDLTIYNINGQIVEQYSGRFEAGNHFVDWDASEVSSGVYLYKVAANGHSMVKRMTLIK